MPPLRSNIHDVVVLVKEKFLEVCGYVVLLIDVDSCLVEYLVDIIREC